MADLASGSRKRLALALVLVLGVSALASVVGGGLALAERRGLVTLRRIPSVEAWSLRHPVDQGWITAVINTDTVGGAFVLQHVREPEKPGSREVYDRFWLPPRSLLLRRVPEGRQIRPKFVHVSKESLVFDVPDLGLCGYPTRILRRGERFRVDLRIDKPGDHVVVPRAPGLRFVETDAMRAASLSDHDRGALIQAFHDDLEIYGYAREIRGHELAFPESARPATLEIDTSDAVTGFVNASFVIFTHWKDGSSNFSDSEPLVVIVLDPDMTVRED